MSSLYVDPTTWDLALDSAGNIALAGAPYSLAQDAASACRTFLGEVWYDTSLGVPYWQKIIGKLPPIAYLKQQLQQQAQSILPDGYQVKVFISGVFSRRVAGQVQISANGAVVAAAGF